MNRRLEDEIAKMAFGDADPRRTAEIERLAETDPEVRRALSQYRAMREGLQAMAPSVEHQLSSERLRDEILRRGLSPKRRAFDWRWASVPLAAAGAFALAAWWPQGPAQTPVLVQAPPTESARVAIADPDPSPEPAPSVFYKEAPAPLPEKVDKPSPIVRSKPSTVAKRTEPKEAPDRTATALAMRASSPSAAPAPRVPGVGGGGGVGAAAGTMGLAADSAQPESDPIVVIQPVRDANTGAYRATEVASPSNVLIGS